MRQRNWNAAGPQRGHFSAPLKKPCFTCVTVSVCSNGCSCSTFITIIMRRRVLIASIKAFTLDVRPSADVLVLCRVPTSYTRVTFKAVLVRSIKFMFCFMNLFSHHHDTKTT